MSTKKKPSNSAAPAVVEPPAPPAPKDPVAEAQDIIDMLDSATSSLKMDLDYAEAEVEAAESLRSFATDKVKRVISGHCRTRDDLKRLLSTTWQDSLLINLFQTVPAIAMLKKNGGTDKQVADGIIATWRHSSGHAPYCVGQTDYPYKDASCLNVVIRTGGWGSRSIKGLKGAQVVAAARELMQIPQPTKAPPPAPPKPSAKKKIAKAPEAKADAPRKPSGVVAQTRFAPIGTPPEAKRVGGKTRAQRRAQLDQTGRPEVERSYSLHCGLNGEDKPLPEMIDAILNVMFGPEAPKPAPVSSAAAAADAHARKADLKVRPPLDPDSLEAPVTLVEADLVDVTQADLEAAYTMEALRGGRIRKLLQSKGGTEYIVIGWAKSEKGPDHFALMPVVPIFEYVGHTATYAERCKQPWFSQGNRKQLEGICAEVDGLEKENVYVLVDSDGMINIAVPKPFAAAAAAASKGAA